MYCSKSSLYEEVERFKSSMGFDYLQYNIDLITLCKEYIKLDLEELNFSSRALRGVAVIGDEQHNDIVLLNKKRSYIERTFDCGHEVMHLFLHRNSKVQTFNCTDFPSVKQDPFLEWQANEGSAEFFVPYKSLLPMIKERYRELNSLEAIRRFKFELSEHYNVTMKVIEYRIESLKYETQQYICGTLLDEIDIMSKSQQSKKKIKAYSLNDKENDFLVNQNHEWRMSLI